MMTYQQSLFLAIPAFVILMSLEYLVAHFQGKKVYSNIPDAISSLSSGMANITVAAIGLVLVLVPYNWLLDNFALFEIDPASPLVWIVVILSMDFTGYWVHRWNHKINAFWQFHLVHHSSEEFNLPVALRQPVNNFINYHTLGLLPAALIGVPVEMIALVGFVHLFYQYWYHTQLIGDLGWLERIIVTPQQHSIHHSMNREYMDKNFGQWFSIWDQMFGTFQLRIEDVKEVYGVTYPVKTWNPIAIDFMHWGVMLRDSFYAKSWADKIKLWYKPTNWRPSDARQQFPRQRVNDVKALEKFNPTISSRLQFWSQVELTLNLGLILLFFLRLPELSSFHTFLFGGFIVFNIVTYTVVMEGKPQAFLAALRFGLFVAISAWMAGDFFQVNQYWQWLTPSLTVFYIMSIWVAHSWNKENQELVSAEALS